MHKIRKVISLKSVLITISIAVIAYIIINFILNFYIIRSTYQYIGEKYGDRAVLLTVNRLRTFSKISTYPTNLYQVIVHPFVPYGSYEVYIKNEDDEKQIGDTKQIEDVKKALEDKILEDIKYDCEIKIEVNDFYHKYERILFVRGSGLEIIPQALSGYWEDSGDIYDYIKLNEVGTSIRIRTEHNFDESDKKALDDIANKMLCYGSIDFFQYSNGEYPKETITSYFIIVRDGRFESKYGRKQEREYDK